MGANIPSVRFNEGETIVERGARGRRFAYTLTAVEPYTRAGGAASALLTWVGECAVCGAPFATKSGRRPRGLARTCLSHRGAWPGSRSSAVTMRSAISDLPASGWCRRHVGCPAARSPT